MKRTVHFHEALKQRTGHASLSFDVDSPTQLFNALRSQVPNFRKVMRQYPEMSIVFTDSERTQFKALTPDLVQFPMQPWATDIHIVPAVKGAGITEGLYAFFTWLGASAATATMLATITINLAVSFAISAIAQALAPSPKTGSGSARADENPSYLYNGAVNVVEQGYPVQVVYGIHTTGSVVIAAGVVVEEYGYGTTQLSAPPYGIPPTETWQFG